MSGGGAEELELGGRMDGGSDVGFGHSLHQSPAREPRKRRYRLRELSTAREEQQALRWFVRTVANLYNDMHVSMCVLFGKKMYR